MSFDLRLTFLFIPWIKKRGSEINHWFCCQLGGSAFLALELGGFRAHHCSDSEIFLSACLYIFTP